MTALESEQPVVVRHNRELVSLVCGSSNDGVCSDGNGASLDNAADLVGYTGYGRNSDDLRGRVV